jgi:hypothetical protein
MQVFVNYRKVFSRSAKIELNGSMLTVSSREDDATTYDLNEIIARYGEDHGCVALAFGAIRSELVWHETTRMSSLYRTPMGKSYTSLLQDMYSINTDLAATGRYNASSPAWALNEAGNLIPILFLMTPYRGCSVDELTIVYHDVRYPDAPEGHVPTTHQFILNGQLLTDVPEMRSIKEWLGAWLPITFDGPDAVAADSVVQYEINADTAADLYVTATAGVINRSLAKTGQVLTLDTRGLAVGETIEIKGGYKFWPNASKKVVTVQ